MEQVRGEVVMAGGEEGEARGGGGFGQGTVKGRGGRWGRRQVRALLLFRLL